MAGIYIHIPFCKKKCGYCNFFSLASSKHREEFHGALIREATLRKDYLGEEPVSSVYFGGGTPSLLNATELGSIFEVLYAHYPIADDAEITLEANPDDLSDKKAREWKTGPVNRLSIGIQSFFDDDLAYLDRVHDGTTARRSIEIAMGAGFDNLTIDLIYGIPTLTSRKWEENLDTFFSFNIPHLSAYSLTVEKKTSLEKLIRNGVKRPVLDVAAIRHFKKLIKRVSENNYIHYEISNFCLEGHYSRHNSLYWLGGNYLGLGPSAHSFNGHSRQWNVSSLAGYIQQDRRAETTYEKEVLTLTQRYNEYVMTSLRTMWGCDAIHIRNVFGKEAENSFKGRAGQFIKKGWLQEGGSKYFLTEEGKLFADGIASDLFLSD